MITAAIMVACDSGDSSSGSSNSSPSETLAVRNESSASVSIANAFDITSANTNTYFIVGTCSENGHSVYGTIGGIDFSTTARAVK